MGLNLFKMAFLTIEQSIDETMRRIKSNNDFFDKVEKKKMLLTNKNKCMKKHLQYMRENISNDARIVMPYMVGDAIIYPSFKKIKRSTAASLIETLCLIYVPAYRDHRVHDIGSTLFVFKENTHKYGVRL
jgi:hypothetical protein